MLFVTLLLLNALMWLTMPALWVCIVLCLTSVIGYSFVFNFFRCPRREFRGDRKDTIVSSVDGRVVCVEEVYEPEWLKSRAIQVSVFMSPLNVHANWFPTDGEVEYVRHHNGRFLAAYLPKSSTENERSSIGIRCSCGERILVRQIAGAMARRIVTYAHEGEEARIDDHLGFIKFGSRVDLYLPLGTKIMVKPDQFTVGGVTTIGKLK